MGSQGGGGTMSSSSSAKVNQSVNEAKVKASSLTKTEAIKVGRGILSGMTKKRPEKSTEK